VTVPIHHSRRIVSQGSGHRTPGRPESEIATSISPEWPPAILFRVTVLRDRRPDVRASATVLPEGGPAEAAPLVTDAREIMVGTTAPAMAA
jgi:hypothetical protein